jgi:hypothetical protein
VPGSLTLQLDGLPDSVIRAAAHEVRSAGLAVTRWSAAEGYLETDWYDLTTSRSVDTRAPGFDHIVKVRLFADPTGGKTRLAAECVVRIAYDPSEPPRDLERMVPDSTPGRLLLNRLVDRLKTVFPAPAPADSTRPKAG